MRSSRSAPDPLAPGPLGFAHRGLHGSGVPENSLAAFRAALAIGAGIECDVRATVDGVPHVFHDERLDRLIGDARCLRHLHSDEARGLKLLGSGEHVPSLRELLALIAGRVPLLIEVKREIGLERLCTAVAEELADYRGPVAVMSFDPRVPRWFATNAPSIRRGLIIDSRLKPWWRELFLRTAHAQFYAVDCRAIDQRWVARMRARRPVYSWTVRSAQDRVKVAKHADAPIWEGDGRP
ncbi:glycerophosphodiester phosphodiesterase [Sphingomonas sp. KRR8]|uniref:glycerophosphodiester phosphodiesterase family protein n=1 Tax=Sphingomonas sp. KRR8 TaxID=2942996 RepID=UPI0020212047|nr:glycerophosphodiester phosphodiesterase family protein [Sphingomonas sp. KRR8]URD60131.1 glycerophosphodiester phosphodiesterase [Sphingomonas sp. KRR8]